MKRKNIVITGISGFLGSTLKNVLEVDHNIYDIGLDITDEDKIKNYRIPGKKIDWIIHTAAIVDVDVCEHDQSQCYKVNFEGTKNIKDLAIKNKARLIYISSVIVFSGEKGNYREQDVPYPKNFYSLSKLLGEQSVLDYGRGLVLRINLMGMHPNGSRGVNFFEWLVDSVKTGKDVQLFNDVMVNPLSNWTVAQLINKIIALNPKEKILHLASKKPLSKADIGKIIIKKLGNYKGKANFISVDGIKDRVFRPKQMWLNTDYVQKKLNLEMPTIESEIEKIFKKSNHYI